MVKIKEGKIFYKTSFDEEWAILHEQNPSKRTRDFTRHEV